MCIERFNRLRTAHGSSVGSSALLVLLDQSPVWSILLRNPGILFIYGCCNRWGGIRSYAYMRCPRWDSNPHRRLRRPARYPLRHGDEPLNFTIEYGSSFILCNSFYSTFFSTTIVKLAARAANAPMAAHTGSSSVPITPTVMGISI